MGCQRACGLREPAWTNREHVRRLWQHFVDEERELLFPDGLGSPREPEEETVWRMCVLNDYWAPPSLSGLAGLPSPSKTPDAAEELPAEDGCPGVDEKEGTSNATGS